MTISCAVCDNTTDLQLTEVEREVVIRKEPITTTVNYYLCPKCGEKSRVMEPDNDPLVQAYRKYKVKQGLLQSEEIRTFRHQYDLTQAELAALLGLGGATLSRYERGQAQDKTHDTLIRMAMDPEQLRELVYGSNDVFSPEKRRTLLQKIDEVAGSETGLFKRVIAATLQRKPDAYTGFKRFDNTRFLNAVLYFCQDGVFKTKLNKLLFYADFKHFKEYTTPITGAAYARVPLGPAPDGYELYFAMMARHGMIEIEEVSYQSRDYTGEEYWAKRDPDLNVFSDSELEVLLSIKKQFKPYKSWELSEFSHEEKGYQETDTGDLISYDYAESLRV